MTVAQRTRRATDAARPGPVEVSIVMPCLNEAETLATCITKAQRAIDEGGLSAEIVVADNGSGDGSQVIDRKLGARVVEETRKSHASALIADIDAAEGRF